MRILHIAAFEGNIGDNASHLGFYNILGKILGKYDVEQLEIRKAYKNYNSDDKLIFDSNFANLANTYDLLVFGGGGFLDYWVKDSINGTTIDIDFDILEQIKTKVLITSVGCNPHKEVPQENYAKFEAFLNYVKKSKNIQIALRNDGSVDSIIKDFGKEYLEGVVEILDHGYFYEPSSTNTLPIEGDYVALNITDDQLTMKGGIDYNRDWYYQELESLIQSLANAGFKVVLVPHIHQDIEAIGTALKKMSPKLVRNNTIIAPCVQGNSGADFIFNVYKNAKCVIASRYHANVCAIKFGVPVIGLSPLQRINYTHKELLSIDTSVKIKDGFSEKVFNLAINEINKIDSKSLLVSEKKEETIRFYRNYFDMVEHSDD